MQKEELVTYWIESSDRDFSTMNHLFEKTDYHWALFMGHLVIEKLLKAYFVKRIDTQPPLTHNLLRLAEKSNLGLTEQQKDSLVTVTTFNIRARYDDYKLAFYKTCTKEFTTHWLTEIKGFRAWIKNQL
ncbi:HEPN domain-containing protein [candidate division KSB1 bacterium]|nr:HEPN domain-containing protein [candidate division KSB1 bacterium]